MGFLYNFIDSFGKSKPGPVATIKDGDISKHKLYIRQKIKATEIMEAETNPKIKKRMKLLIEEGIYDFTGIKDF